MQIFGKLLGAFFGFLFGGVIGAALGCFIGHQFDKGMSRNAGFNPGSFAGGQIRPSVRVRFLTPRFR